jgi:hypothetical protein
VNRDSLFLVDVRTDYRLGFDVVMRRVTRDGMQDIQTLTGDGYRALTVGWNRKVRGDHGEPYVEEGIWLRRDNAEIEWEFWTWAPPDGPMVVLTAAVRDGEVGVSWLAEIGRTYQVQVTSDLQAWEDYGARIYGDNAHARVVMVDPGYRLIRVIAFE